MRRSHIIIFLFVLVLISSLSTTDHILQSNVSQASDFSRVAYRANTPSYDELIAKAQTKGMVRIIVGLNVPFQPEADVSRSQAIQQRQRIARVQDELIQRMLSYNITFVKKLSIIPYVVLEVDALALQKLVSDPEVASIEEDAPIPPTLSDSIPLIGADTVWSFGYSGFGQTVAILDSGIDKTHPFLTGKVVAEACYSTNSTLYNATTICPNGLEEQIGSGAGVNCSTLISGCNHGTHVAGIAVGKGANFSGVAKDATLIAIQVFSRFEDNAKSTPCADKQLSSPCVQSFTGDQLEALEWVYTLRNNYNIAAVNMSLGGEEYFSPCDSWFPSTKALIDNLRSVGIATVIASGNDSYTNAISTPACISTAISVGATYKSDIVWESSNSASFLDLLAPGVLINSSIPGGSFTTARGTSMAAPHVAGAWAVLKSKSPGATVDEILSSLKDTGILVQDTRNGITTPRVQLDAAAGIPILLTFTTELEHQTVVETVVTTGGDVNDLVFRNRITTDNQGDYTFEIPKYCLESEIGGLERDFDIYVKPNGYLRQKLSAKKLHFGSNSFTFASSFQQGDVDGDNKNGVQDVLIVLKYWGPVGPRPEADLDRDGMVGIGDLLIILGNWAVGEHKNWDYNANPKPECDLGEEANLISKSAQTPMGTITLVSEAETLTVGDTFDIQVLIDTADHAADGVDLILLYDPGVLEVQDIVDGGIYSNIRESTAVSSLGEIHFSADGTTFQGSGTLATITFQAVASVNNTAVKVHYNEGWTADTNIVESGTILDVLGHVNSVSLQINGSPSRPMPIISLAPLYATKK